MLWLNRQRILVSRFRYRQHERVDYNLEQRLATEVRTIMLAKFDNSITLPEISAMNMVIDSQKKKILKSSVQLTLCSVDI